MSFKRSLMSSELSLPRRNRLLNDLLPYFPCDRRLMLLAEKDNQIVGGVLGFSSIL